MAIEIYHTLKSDKGRDFRSWRYSGVRCRGSWTTFMAGIKHIEEKYLPSVELEHPILHSSRKQGEYCSRMSLAIAICLSMPFEMKKETIKNEIDKLWALERDPRLSTDERLFFSSFMDRAVFRAEDAETVTQAWRNVSAEIGQSSKEDFNALADAVLELVKNNDDVFTIAVNWNSINDFYGIFGETDDNCYDFVVDFVRIVENPDA